MAYQFENAGVQFIELTRSQSGCKICFNVDSIVYFNEHQGICVIYAIGNPMGIMVQESYEEIKKAMLQEVI